MKKFLATTMMAAATCFAATSADAAVTDLTFGAPSDEGGGVYRYSNVTGDGTVDLLLTLGQMSPGAVIKKVDGNATYFGGGSDNLTVVLDRDPSVNENYTWVHLTFDFVVSGTTTATSVADSVLTFADIDSFGNILFSDFVELDPTTFPAIISVGSDLIQEDLASIPSGSPLTTGVRYIGPLNRTDDVLGNDPDQIGVSVILSSTGVQSFEVVWGFYTQDPTARPGERGMLLDGSFELESTNPVPEPASAALLGLGGLVLAAASRRRR